MKLYRTKKIVAAITMLMAAIVPTSAQEKEWEPIGVWPFVYQSFKPATVVTGVFTRTETVVPCNIHVGKSMLWFCKDGETLMEAIPDNIVKVTFKNGDVYMSVGNTNRMGQVIYDGELQKKTARVFMVYEVNQAAVDQKYLDYINKTQNMLQGGGGTYFSHLADAATEEPDKSPVPLKPHFYYLFNGDLFEANTKNILAHIKPERKKEYKAYTRSAEVISTSKKSMMKVWEDFFVNYDTPTKK